MPNKDFGDTGSYSVNPVTGQVSRVLSQEEYRALPGKTKEAIEVITKPKKGKKIPYRDSFYREDKNLVELLNAIDATPVLGTNEYEGVHGSDDQYRLKDEKTRVLISTTKRDLHGQKGDGQGSMYFGWVRRHLAMFCSMWQKQDQKKRKEWEEKNKGKTVSVEYVPEYRLPFYWNEVGEEAGFTKEQLRNRCADLDPIKKRTLALADMRYKIPILKEGKEYLRHGGSFFTVDEPVGGQKKGRWWLNFSDEYVKNLDPELFNPVFEMALKDRRTEGALHYMYKIFNRIAVGGAHWKIANLLKSVGVGEDARSRAPKMYNVFKKSILYTNELGYCDSVVLFKKHWKTEKRVEITAEKLSSLDYKGFKVEVMSQIDSGVSFGDLLFSVKNYLNKPNVESKSSGELHGGAEVTLFGTPSQE